MWEPGVTYGDNTTLSGNTLTIGSPSMREIDRQINSMVTSTFNADGECPTDFIPIRAGR